MSAQPMAQAQPRLRKMVRRATYKWTTSPYDDTLRSRVARAVSEPRPWWDWGHRVMWLVGRYDAGSAGAPRGRDLWWVPGYAVEEPHQGMLRDLRQRYGCFTTTDYTVVRATGDRIDWRIFDLQDDGHTVVIGRWPSSFGDDGRIQPLVGGLSHSEMRLLLSWYVVDHKIKAQWLGLRSWAYYRALHASVHDRKPFSCQATPARWSGGYSHWHCRLRRRHTGPHRVGAYTWSGQGCVIYDGERAS